MTTPVLMLLWAASVLAVGYIYVGYPLLVALLSRCGESLPTVPRETRHASVVIVAYNEAARLPAKIRSIQAADTGCSVTEILIASDGSDDGTHDLDFAAIDPRCRLLAFRNRRGKASVLNDAVPQCREALVVLMDARQRLTNESLLRLLAPFDNPQIGVVSGELVLQNTDGSTAAEGVGFYWTYEKFLRRCESRFRSVPGATGALYALRRELFAPIPANTLLDDVMIPMQAVVQGARCVFAPGAVALDTPSKSSSQEAIRKRRTIAGAAQLMLLRPGWLLPWRNPIWWEYVSHKLARLASPVLLIVAAVTNVWLLNVPVFVLLGWLQVVFYLAAGIGWLYQWSGRKSSLFGPFLMFATLNITTLLALWDALQGRFQARWQRAA